MTETAGERIQRLAKELDKPSGKHLAAELGVSYEALRQWTKGDTAPNRARAEAIAKYLGVTPEMSLRMTICNSTSTPGRNPQTGDA